MASPVQGHRQHGALRCPIHNGSNDKQFVVNIRNNTWCCFGDCRKGGSILELVASYEKIDIREAAVRIASWFPLSLPHSPRRSTVMSDNKKPTHKVFVVEEREGEGKDEDAFWTRVGSAWPHKDGKGFNIVLSALAAERPPRLARVQRRRRQSRKRKIRTPRRLQKTITVALFFFFFNSNPASSRSRSIAPNAPPPVNSPPRWYSGTSAGRTSRSTAPEALPS